MFRITLHSPRLIIEYRILHRTSLCFCSWMQTQLSEKVLILSSNKYENLYSLWRLRLGNIRVMVILCDLLSILFVWYCRLFCPTTDFYWFSLMCSYLFGLFHECRIVYCMLVHQEYVVESVSVIIFNCFHFSIIHTWNITTPQMLLATKEYFYVY